MAVILGCIPAISQSIFSTDFKTIEDFNQWTVVDVNNDGCTWKFDDWASPSYVFYSYSSANSADDWMISPAITSDSAYLTWDAMSFNASYPETYSIKVSDYEDVSWWYSTEAEIINETGVFKTRGVDLSKYAGKEVYIAFQLETKNGDCLILDNIGLYGSFDLSGIENVAADDMEIIVANGYISINSENVENIAIYDLSGRIATQSTANTISTESLNSGIYIVKVATSTGITTQKIAIK